MFISENQLNVHQLGLSFFIGMVLSFGSHYFSSSVQLDPFHVKKC